MKNIMGMMFFCGLIMVMVLHTECDLVIPPGEEVWINYPLDTTIKQPFTKSKKHQKIAVCKVLQDHKKRSSASKAWQLKYDELHAQCAVETIEEAIKRLQRQLAKDRERLNKAKEERAKSK